MNEPGRQPPHPLYTLWAFRAARWLGARLPRRIALQFGRVISALAVLGNTRPIRVLRENLSHLTGLRGPALEQLVHGTAVRFGEMLSDYFHVTAADSRARVDALVQTWRGGEHVKAALEVGKGVILVTGHLGHWELGGLALAARGYGVTIVTAEEPSAELTAWRDALRREFGIKSVTVGPGREMAFLELIHALRRNEIVAMLVDRPFFGGGHDVTFFGEKAQFSHAPSALWRHTGAAILPAFVFPEPDGTYALEARAAITFQRERDPHAEMPANTQRLATAFEGYIRENAGVWFQFAPAWPRDGSSE